MHFEINDGRTEADCARALSQLRAQFGKPNAEDDDVDLNDKLPDFYADGRPDLTVGNTMAWGAAHAAHARDAAAESCRRLDVLAAQVGALTQQLGAVQTLLRQMAGQVPK